MNNLTLYKKYKGKYIQNYGGLFIRFLHINRLKTFIDIIKNKNKNFYNENDYYQNSEYQNVPLEDFTDIFNLIKTFYKNVSSIDLSEDEDNYYCLKFILPPDSKIIYFGDFHSSIHSLIECLQRLIKEEILDNSYKLKDNYYMIFCGDLVDRGPYGIEIMYIVFLLMIINNYGCNDNNFRVLVLNGNHEEYRTYKKYGLKEEMNHQFKGNLKNNFFTKSLLFLPLACFIKSNNDTDTKWYQFCHGGIDKDTQYDTDKIKEFLSDDKNVIDLKDTNDKGIGFLWSDFTQKFEYDIINSDRKRKVFSYAITKGIMVKNNIRNIISGHQDLTNYAFQYGFLRNYEFEVDSHYNGENGKLLLYTHEEIQNSKKEIDKEFKEIEKTINIDMSNIQASVISSAVISRELTFNTFGILYLENNKSDIFISNF